MQTKVLCDVHKTLPHLLLRCNTHYRINTSQLAAEFLRRNIRTTKEANVRDGDRARPWSPEPTHHDHSPVGVTEFLTDTTARSR